LRNLSCNFAETIISSFVGKPYHQMPRARTLELSVRRPVPSIPGPKVTGRLCSGDVNLIYPGEPIVLLVAGAQPATARRRGTGAYVTDPHPLGSPKGTLGLVTETLKGLGKPSR
jgi:hypothetical protein